MRRQNRSHVGQAEVHRPYEHLSGPTRLQAWRAKEKLDSKRAAARLGINPATYCAFELGRKRPGIDIGMRIEIRTGGRVALAHWVDPRKTPTLGVAA